ncbi:MAG: hypothetical protein WC679_12765 [Bacteroidales bacterium]
MGRKNDYWIIGPILLIILILLGCFGWSANIYEIFITEEDNLSAKTILRIVGIFLPPLGAILGYF